ncbi:NAD(P)-binding protein [Parathielavia hyrcaniae]|uniref:NAD(P)-binding protein n=1 Tax=Parathielavia hyrcaniae TaxID=113614 RepID=A0AAN6Q5W7_9PEZI|nr:NAD(P)-binding protein [Parathielavia hyrcaniae]
MGSIKTVAVLGGSGHLGPTIVHELVAAGFIVTGIMRDTYPSRISFWPDRVTIKKVHYNLLHELEAAFQGQDAVVSVLARTAYDEQINAINAAVAAGVKRFIPSEYSVINLHKPPSGPGPALSAWKIHEMLDGKIKTIEHLEHTVQAAKDFTWTALSTGLIFDRVGGLSSAGDSGLGFISLRTKQAFVIDSGNEKFHVSTLAQVGRAVVGVLNHPERTANKYLSTASFNVSRIELIALVEEVTRTKIAIRRISWWEMEAAGFVQASTVSHMSAFGIFLSVYTSQDGVGNALSEEESANSLLGLPYEDLRSSVVSWLRREGAL